MKSKQRAMSFRRLLALLLQGFLTGFSENFKQNLGCRIEGDHHNPIPDCILKITSCIPETPNYDLTKTS